MRQVILVKLLKKHYIICSLKTEQNNQYVKEKQTLFFLRNKLREISEEAKNDGERCSSSQTFMESLILAQDERWRRA